MKENHDFQRGDDGFLVSAGLHFHVFIPPTPGPDRGGQRTKDQSSLLLVVSGRSRIDRSADRRLFYTKYIGKKVPGKRQADSNEVTNLRAAGCGA